MVTDTHGMLLIEWGTGRWVRRGEMRYCAEYIFHTTYQLGLLVTKSVYSKNTLPICFKNINKNAVAFKIQYRWALMMEGRFVLK